MRPRSPGSGSPADITVFSGWRLHDNLAQFADILREHDAGFFSRSAMLVDELFTDNWIQGVTETRIGELLSSPLKINPATDKRKARKVAEEIGGTDGYSGLWETIAPSDTVATLAKWAIFLGFAVASIEWEKTPEAYTPRLVPWHPANAWWDDWKKTFVMNTQGAGQVALPRPDRQPYGDGKWLVWCPYGVQYGWRSGIIRSLGEVYLSRRYAKRDFNRWTERHGIGIVEGKVPGGASEESKANFRRDLGNIGSDGVVITPQGVDKDTPGYGVEMVDAGGAGTSWQGIKGLIEDANTDVSVLVLGGNLNTDMKEGSLAAADSQRKTSVNRALRDATIGPVIGRQVLYHWADLNYDDPKLAPIPCYEVLPPEDAKAEAETLKILGEGLIQLATASPRVDIDAILEAEGVPMLSEEEVLARQEEERERAAEAAAEIQAASGAGEEAGAGGEADPAEKTTPNGQPKARAALSGMLEKVRKRYSFAGLDIAVENPAGTLRPWVEGERTNHTVMKFDYGFIDGVMGHDKEELDVYIGPDPAAAHVYVVRQYSPIGAGGRWIYDEDKVMLGFGSAEEAKAAYLAHRDDGERAFGGMLVLTPEKFKAKLRRRGAATTKLTAVAEVGRELMALAARARGGSSRGRSAAGSRRAAKYTAAVVELGKRRAARALAPDLAALKAEVDACENLADLKTRLLKRFRGMDPTGLARVVQKANILANFAGRSQALEEV